MTQNKPAYRVLCVCGSEKGKAFLQELLPDRTGVQFKTASCADQALAAAMGEPFDICMINTPLPDGSGIRLAADIAKKTNACILLFVRSEEYPAAIDAVQNLGVFTVEKPNSEKLYRQAVQLLLTVRCREATEEEKISDLQARLDEIKIVNRAKLVLIQYLKMDEAKAHRYIEKQAMDRRITRREVAEIILSTYEY